MMKRQPFDRRLVTILLIVFVQMVGASLILPILPLFARREFDLPPTLITLLVSSFFIAQFLAGPYLGRLSDRHGRIPVLIVSQIGTAISFLAIALAPSAWVLFAARIFDGITGGNIIVAQAYVTDITPGERRTEALGYIMAMFGLGFIIGPGLGGLLSAWFGPRVPYLFAAAAAGLVVLLTWLELDESLSAEQRAANVAYRQNSLSLAQIGRNAPLLLILIVAFIGQFGLGQIQATFALYGEAVIFQGASEATVNIGIGLLLTAVGVGQFTTQSLLLRPMLRRFGDVPLIFIGLVARTVGLLIWALVTSPWLAAGGSLLFAFGMGTMMPPLQSLTTKTVADELRGGVLGIFQSVASLGTIFSTAIAGIIFTIGPTMPHWVSAVLTVAALIPTFLLARQLQPIPTPL